MAKYRMGTVTTEAGDKLTCSRGTLWPPINIIIHGSTEAARPYVDEFAYHGLRVWEQVCGLRQMEESKCSTCPYVELNGKLATPIGGKARKPQYVTATEVAQKRGKANKPGR